MAYIRNTAQVEKFTEEEDNVRKITESSRKNDRDEIFNSILSGILEKLGIEIQLNTDPEVAVSCLLDHVDVLAVTPTGFARV